jgi:hypothetical protein
MQNEYIPPNHLVDAFFCPHCGVFSKQYWYERINAGDPKDPHVRIVLGNIRIIKDLSVSYCGNCSEYSLWINDKIQYPLSSLAPLPVENMPKDVKDDYFEASAIFNASPRAAAALLRLALQKLMKDLGENGKNLNENIGNLVKKGLPERVQKAADALRVIGNNAVHPGEIDLKDNNEMALALFDLLNIFVESMITQPKKIEEIFEKLPTKDKESIEKRDLKK